MDAQIYRSSPCVSIYTWVCLSVIPLNNNNNKNTFLFRSYFTFKERSRWASSSWIIRRPLSIKNEHNLHFFFHFSFTDPFHYDIEREKKRRNLLLVMFETRPLSMVLIVRCTPTCVFLFLSIYPSRFQQSIQQSVPEKRVFQDAKHVKYTVYERYRLCVCVSTTQQNTAVGCVYS